MIGSRRQLWRIKTGREVRFENDRMRRGTEVEPRAIRDYLTALDNEHELAMGPAPSSTFRQVGFLKHPAYDFLGGSPDGLLGLDVLPEFKAPAPDTFGTISFYEEVPEYYMPQVQGLLDITNRFVCDFVCWTPSGMKVWEITRSFEYMEWMVPHLAEFQSFVDANIEPPRFGRNQKPKFDGVIEISAPRFYTPF